MKKVLVIAEAGVNHNGSLERAIELVRVAADAGADFIKFQTFKASLLTTSSAPMADYQKKNLELGAQGKQTQQDMLKKLELSFKDHDALIKECKQVGIKFLSTAFDFESLEFLKKLDLELWKIPSGEITNYPYLKKIAQTQKPIILSTGMCDLKEVDDAISVLLENGSKKEDITVLHCTTDYPAPMNDVNLLAMPELGKQLGVAYGYSDHTLGILVPLAAVALGATVIEKHFTLDRNLPGPDHKASLEPEELKQMVLGIRELEKALGSKIKKPTEAELKNRIVARKSIVAAKTISVGDIFTEENLTTKRPGSGISPMKWAQILGTKSKKDYSPGDLI